MITRGEFIGFENLINPSFENMESFRKNGKLYYIIMNQEIKMYRFVDGKILTTDSGLKDVVVLDTETKKMFSAFYTDKNGLIYIYKEYIF